MPDPKTEDAVRYCILCISEAASKGIPDYIKAQRPEAPWRDIRNMGNILRHAYAGTLLSTVWETATQSLPEFRKTVLELKDALGSPGAPTEGRGK